MSIFGQPQNLLVVYMFDNRIEPKPFNFFNVKLLTKYGNIKILNLEENYDQRI
jgi:hypothetical protein